MRVLGKPKSESNIYKNHDYPQKIKITEDTIFHPITITLFTCADPRLSATFSCCNKAYTFCVPFEKLGLKIEVIPLDLNFTCYCPKCRFAWIYMMFQCPECDGRLNVEQFESTQDQVNPRKFFVGGVPTIEIDHQSWIEGAGFTQLQLAKAINDLYLEKDQQLQNTRLKRWEKYMYADYIEILIPSDHLPSPFNRKLIRKSALKVKDSMVDLKHLVLEEVGLRVMPDEWKIHHELKLNIVTLPELGWQLKGAIIPKEQYIDLANIGAVGKTARTASNAYATKTTTGE